jgi:hypothetical protein
MRSLTPMQYTCDNMALYDMSLEDLWNRFPSPSLCC